jgi:excisionase family DNA binding protein
VKAPVPLPEVLTVAEAAMFLRISVSMLYDLTRQRGRVRQDIPIPVIKLGAHSLRFRKSSLEAWIAQLEQQTA